MFQKNFLQPERIGIILVEGYTDNRKQSKKAIAWLKFEERKDWKRILHGSNGKDRRLPELPGRNVPTACWRDTLAQRYEATKSRIERIAQAGYEVKFKWEFKFALSNDLKVEESIPWELETPCTVGEPKPFFYITE